ncbi:MAG: hypothetical protein EOO00_04950 [Chitinophagaceae bacterium]|nr:MAG: hypothetical protein EOO00_04950 [Chitinophagaceae bacterium]
MQKFTLNKYDFVRFVLEERKDTRLEDTVFWISTFPLPVYLVHDIFEHRGPLVKTFLNHLHAVLIYADALKQVSSDWNREIDAQPTPDNKSRKDYFFGIFEKGLKDPSIKQVIGRLSSMLMVYGYDPSVADLFEAICHSGRKYKRLYLPKPVKDAIQDYNPQLLKSVSSGNGDMFGQPVADEFNIYRMGFSDKLSTIFNKLLDFIITYSNGNNTNGLANASDIKVIQRNVPKPDSSFFEYGSVSDGSVWEPAYRKASTVVILNQKHPFSDLLKDPDASAEMIVSDLLHSLSECENEAVTDREKNFYETMRQNVSRKLRSVSVRKL